MNVGQDCLAVSSLCRKQFPRPGRSSGLTLVAGAAHICCQLFSLFPKRVANIRAGSSPNRLLRTNELKSGEERNAAPGTFRSNFSAGSEICRKHSGQFNFRIAERVGIGVNIVAGRLHVSCQMFSLFSKCVANIGATYFPSPFPQNE